MKLESYELVAGQNLRTFEFLSTGRKGQITKVVQFQHTDIPGIYNLAFGDKNFNTDEFDDKVVTDNGDSEKVLASVVSALYVFTSQYPDAWVYATGSTKARTRLYQMGINKYYDIVRTDFDIMCEHLSEWELFEQNKDYQAFAVRKKNSKFDI